MAFQRTLPWFATAVDLLEMDFGPAQRVQLHRYPPELGMPHEDSPDCWCSPWIIAEGDLVGWSPAALDHKLAHFYRVH